MDTGAEVQQLLQVGGILPFTIVFDAEGREIYRHIGYKDGDEQELRHEIEQLLARVEAGERPDTGKADWSEAVTATDRFEYSYSGETRREIFENWLDVSYQFGGFRTGIMLNSQAPSEEGDRSNTIKHRFFEFKSSNVFVRAGHFYGIFGRGVIFNAYEDRVVRVDTRLDGLLATTKSGNFSATAFSGTPSVAQKDIRAADLKYLFGGKVNVAVTGMTYRRDDEVLEDAKVNRDWVTSGRLQQNFGFGDYYVEYGYPHDSWTWLRNNAPVQFMARDSGTSYWAVTKHADIIEISKQPEKFTNHPRMVINPLEQELEAERTRAEGGFMSTMRTIIQMDGEDHR